MVAQRPLRYTRHAETVIRERSLDRMWIERTVRDPESNAVDANDPSVKRFYRTVPENGNRILRVVCVETPEEIRILSAYFDRGAGKL